MCRTRFSFFVYSRTRLRSSSRLTRCHPFGTRLSRQGAKPQRESRQEGTACQTWPNGSEPGRGPCPGSSIPVASFFLCGFAPLRDAVLMSEDTTLTDFSGDVTTHSLAGASG